MYSIKYLDIKGYKDQPVPNTFFQQNQATQHLTILLPGMGYTSHMPLLYYPALIMLDMGSDMLRLEYEYNRRQAFMELPGEERKKWLLTDVTNASYHVLKKGPYKDITIIGKSIGTRAMGYLLKEEDDFKQARAIWLTPVLRSETLREQIKECEQTSLFVIGTADPHYDQTYLDKIQRARKGEVLVIEGADHSLEIKGDILASLGIMERVIRTIQAFVTP